MSAPASDHFHGPPLDPLQQVHVFPVLRAPELDAVLQVRSHQSGVEGQNHFKRFMLQSRQQVGAIILRHVFQPDHT